jgi:hypothetical protein
MRDGTAATAISGLLLVIIKAERENHPSIVDTKMQLMKNRNFNNGVNAAKRLIEDGYIMHEDVEYFIQIET